MGKEEEIRLLLEEGLSPKEIIERGYAKSTVYKVRGPSRKISRKGMSVDLFYTVSSLIDESDYIKMGLEEYVEIPREEIERARQDSELEKPVELTQLKKVDFTPEPESPEERIIAAMKKQMPEVFEDLGITVSSLSRPPRMVLQAIKMKPREIEVYLTHGQYITLGSPTLLSLIKLTLKVN